MKVPALPRGAEGLQINYPAHPSGTQDQQNGRQRLWAGQSAVLIRGAQVQPHPHLLIPAGLQPHLHVMSFLSPESFYCFWMQVWQVTSTLWSPLVISLSLTA